MKYELPKLPYEFDSLEPHIDSKTMEIHYSKHHQGYVNKLNNALENSPIEDENLEKMLSNPELIPPNIKSAKVPSNPPPLAAILPVQLIPTIVYITLFIGKLRRAAIIPPFNPYSHPIVITGITALIASTLP